ncbi:STAGA complex 65 subunit gamma [Amphibalanus amphitrite]|uniref:STAGA complex 65 subunit gamma n=1 Tax=Amphibalanus amphitrite TaxID=1232801 RepID=A0A6A4WRM6_AMPAM|nr:uncharacterized protein LOC122383290 [Amphibalanus amphitrite]XP_043225503.1 uncharacterized protein LOC122383290 [Amphibalanus amphitrite]XP_043225504.1 uncharacterized protein LOC122383290 [Amphibalanus amphitrite]XP_043225505.1 uncharacterized protein LOC122383290 [Amphibalanus amphitrite]XP_043225506.1 uncharacterized protein LOC122383290 [Amphibalanus amphitrite]XP_043225507.1 uncharacterized protein LOC122383290 [Amphibalanus amphitrite]XP_043225508.1 uncharacterized protein LOC12238
MSTSEHWGEYETPPPPLKALRPEELQRLAELQLNLVVEGPKLFQPADVNAEQDVKPAVAAFRMDPLVLATIQLDRQNAALSRVVASSSTVDDSILTPVDLTECFDKLEEKFTVFPEVKDSGFVRGSPVAIPEIPAELCRDLMVRSVGAIAAHAGFHTSTDLVLGTLADATANFLRSLCLMLRQTRDSELERGPHGFVDALERTLVDSGVGSVRQLAEYYGPNVVERLRQARDTNYQLRASYDQMTADRQPPVESIALDDSLLVDILAETPTGLPSVGPGGTIDMSAYPNMSFESADDLVGMNSSLDSEEIVVQSSPLPDAASPLNKKPRP